MIETARDVVDALLRLETKVYNIAHNNVKEDDRLIDQDIDCKQPKGEPEHVPPDALREMRKSANQVFVETHSFKFNNNDTQKEKDLNERLEKVFEWAIESNDVENEGAVGDDLAWDISRGFSCLKGPTWDAELLAEGKCPIVFSPVELLNVFPDPAGRYVIEAGDMYAEEIEENVRKWNEDKKLKIKFEIDWVSRYKNNEKLRWIEFWSKDKRMFAVASQGTKGAAHAVSEMGKNRLGYIPFPRSYSGWGMGRSRGKIEDRMVGRLKGMRSAIQARAMGMSATLGFLRYNVWPTTMYPVEAQEFFKTGSYAVRPGARMAVPHQFLIDGTASKVMERGNIAQELPFYLGMSAADIEGLGGGDAIQGGGDASDSGLKQMTRIRQASLDYKKPRRGLEGMYSENFTNTIKLLANEVVVGKDQLNLDGVKIKPDEIDTSTRATFIFEFKDPIKDRDTLETGERLQERKSITQMEFRELYAKLPDNDTYYERLIAEEMLLSDPQARMLAFQQWAAENGYVPAGGAVDTGDAKQQTMPQPSEQRLQTAAGNNPVDTRDVTGAGGQV